MKYRRISLLTVGSILLSGCHSSRVDVGPGDYVKLYAPSGLYVELFVPDYDSDKVGITIGRDSLDEPFTSLYYDGVNLRKILLMRSWEGTILDLNADPLNLQGARVFAGNLNSEVPRARFRVDLVPEEPDEDSDQASEGRVSEDVGEGKRPSQDEDGSTP